MQSHIPGTPDTLKTMHQAEEKSRYFILGGVVVQLKDETRYVRPGIFPARPCIGTMPCACQALPVMQGDATPAGVSCVLTTYSIEKVHRVALDVPARVPGPRFRFPCRRLYFIMKS